MVKHSIGKCKRGHKLRGDNKYVAPKTGIVGCRKCRNKASSEWRKKINYNQNYMFGNNREAAISRDGGKCVHCGMTREEHKNVHGRDITVDHIDGRGSKHSREQKNNKLSNLQTLCVKCHGKKDSNRIVPVRGESHYRSKIDEEDVQDILMFHDNGINIKNIARAYPLSSESVRAIVRRINWKHVKPRGTS